MPIPEVDNNAEIPALIESLLRTERRLEELTGGEVDTVTDQGGRMFLLRRAQNHMRESDAARQVAILDALPASIALLDSRGMVVSVNAAWQRFSEQSALLVHAYGIGLDYLAICDAAQGDDAWHAHQVAEGIRSILNGAVDRFSLEYPCHSPTEKRWYLMTATPISSGIARGAVVMHMDISERVRGEQELRESERRFSSLLADVEMISVMLDSDARITYCNAYLLKLTGWQFEEVIGRDWFEFFIAPELHSEQKALFQSIFRNQPEAMHGEHAIRTRTGENRHIRWNSSVLRSGAGDEIGVASIGEDITEYKQATEELQFKNTMLLTQQETSLDGILVVDENGGVVSYNHRFTELWNIPLQLARAGLDARLIELVADQVADPQGFVAGIRYLYAHPEAKSADELLLKDGRSIDRYSAPMGSANSKYYGRVWYFRDITERKKSQVGIERLNRVYAVLSGINALIVRVQDREELFRETCRIAVADGRFIRAAVAIVDPASRRLAVVARQGIGMDLPKATLVALDEELNAENSLPSQAVRGRKPAIANDIIGMLDLPFREEWIATGSRAIFALPLLVADEVIGVIALHSSEPNFFDRQEVELLLELAANISFALDHIEKSKKVAYLAYYDQLTGLANQILFLKRVSQHLRSAAARGHKMVVFLIDLERFKNINDSLGRSAGDVLLRQVAQWLTLKSGDANLLARISADHFALMVPEVKPDGNLVRLVEAIVAGFVGHSFRLNDTVFRVAARVGAAIFPDDGLDAETLFRNAEAALKKAKSQGERYLFYTQIMTNAVAGRPTLENRLRQAFIREEFVLHYQPKMDLASGKLNGAEALIRWNDPQSGLVPPGQFIPVLEETGMIFDVGRWALKKAVADYLRWRAAGLPAVRIAVNVSPLQLRHRDFVADISQIVGADARARDGLELEITESVIMEDVKNTIVSLSAIRSQGVRIAIDDFGTGFSSLSHLAKLPVDTLKIDRSFVIEMTVTPQGLALVSTIIDLAHSLKLNVVAEGVETKEQSRLLLLLKCDDMQGFLFSKPVPAEIFEVLFLGQTPAG